jgi:hypothetical protein
MPRRRKAPPEVLEREFEVVLPVQFFRGTRGALQPERRLMLAVLEDAVVRYRRDPHGRDGHESALWFASEDTSWPYSFTNVCDVLGLDRRAVRDALDIAEHAGRIPAAA